MKNIENGILGVVISILVIVLIFEIIPCIVSQYNGTMFDANTGAIGDTIGGIANPIVGGISIALLFYTLREQIKSNNLQKTVSDYDMLMKLRNDILEKSKNITVKVHSESFITKDVYEGTLSLHEVNAPGVSMSEDDFDNLYDSAAEIVACYQLFIRVVRASVLAKEIKKDFWNSIQKPFEDLYSFLKTCKNIDERIICKWNSTNALPEEDELFDDENESTSNSQGKVKPYKERIIKLLAKMEAMRADVKAEDF